VTADIKEALRERYEEVLAEAKWCATDFAACKACGSTNVVGSVGAGGSKFKICVGCHDCGDLILWG
jgi:hypothetical protein